MDAGRAENVIVDKSASSSSPRSGACCCPIKSVPQAKRFWTNRERGRAFQFVQIACIMPATCLRATSARRITLTLSPMELSVMTVSPLALL